MTEIISTNRLIAETNAAIARYTQTLLRQILLNSNDNVLFASRPPTPFRYPTSPNFRPSSLRRPQPPPPPPPTNERTAGQDTDHRTTRTDAQQPTSDVAAQIREGLRWTNDAEQDSQRRNRRRRLGDNELVGSPENILRFATEEEAAEAVDEENPNNFIAEFINFLQNDAIQNIARIAAADTNGRVNNIAIFGENNTTPPPDTNNGMTSSQIREATSSGPYSQFIVPTDNESSTPSLDNDAGNSTAHRCPISWTPFENDTPVLKINACGHIFSERSLTEWLRLHSTCPTCRHNLIDTNEEHRQNSTDNIPDGANIPLNPNEPVGVNMDSSSNSSFGIFTNLLQGSPINADSVLGNLHIFRENFNRNVTNSNVE
tara:strand:- start:426 stop:1544 length:1119 start_codon:yes stop_codon:yes gene_type:complete